MTLALYGHPFSSYTWKALIALHAIGAEFEFREVGPDHPEHSAFVAGAGAAGKFPVLVDDGKVLFEATTIVEHLAQHHDASRSLLPADPDAAIEVRTIDRVFDNYVMSPVQVVVDEYILTSGAPDPARLARQMDRLDRSYAWIEGWLGEYTLPVGVTLIECAAAPSLFYADWVNPLGDRFPRLAGWRAHVLALPEVARCVEAARPYRGFFPPGAPDRD